MFFAVVECPGKSLKIVFMKDKWLSVVTAVNGFTERKNESQMLFRKKYQNAIGFVISAHKVGAHQKELKLHVLK